MCIVSGLVKSVADTKIFVAPSQGGTRQLVVYQNRVDTDRPNLMILPVPNPSTLQFEDLVMRYTGLFDDASHSFFKQRGYSQETAAWQTRSAAAQAEPPPLEVYTIGPYQASVAETFEDLGRLDRSVFQPSQDLLTLLSSYQTPFGTATPPIGFLCCQLLPGRQSYEPIAYSHAADSRGLFVPTRHYHPGEDATAAAADWDHEIFSIGALHQYAHRDHGPAYWLPRPRNEINWSLFPREFRAPQGAPLCRWACSGSYTNVDLMFPLAGQMVTAPASPPSSGRGLERILSGLRGAWR